eukprot:CAMPEP_0116905580 /NCGR_PEP_ID=MMETSP0467-20121206/12058_1 /TAXON_ID=283647 /ORGANISM="Mesodinium pulex, Strain SPMC105" /LENGTH=149 /DNA_ID=CAMNT_0004580361 /DNA_START=696 /DNA_END=1145 /DNA_ORIENTATION=-
MDGNFSQVMCVSECPASKYMCYGRGVSEGIVFCGDSNLTAQDNIDFCYQVPHSTVLDTDFSRAITPLDRPSNALNTASLTVTSPAKNVYGSSFALAGDAIVEVGGLDAGSYSASVMRSTDGYNWTQVSTAVAMKDSACLVNFNGALYSI